MEMPRRSQLQIGNMIVITVTSALEETHAKYRVGWGTRPPNVLAAMWTLDIFSVLCKVLWKGHFPPGSAPCGGRRQQGRLLRGGDL